MKGHPYIDLTVTIKTTGEERDMWRDAAVFYLSEAGFSVFDDDEEGRLHAYVEKEAFSEKSAREALAPLGDKAEAAYTEIADRDWNEEWEKNYHRPVEVLPGRLVVRASFHTPRPDLPFDLIIDPKMAFGTGNHATTAGMLRLIDTLDIRGKSVTDMGCGSGVLGIFALKKGAARCTSIDIDDRSTENALLNARVNGVTLDVRLGDARILKEVPKADVFLANITRNIILEDLDRYLEALRERGIILLSGFINKDLPLISEALSARGLAVTETINPSGDWIALKAHRPVSESEVQISVCATEPESEAQTSVCTTEPESEAQISVCTFPDYCTN